MRDYPDVEVRSRTEWRRWLRAHHRQDRSIWLVTWKKGSEHYLSYEAVVEEALCFGWVDSLPRALDAHRTKLLLSPRKAGSSWSAANRKRVERLERVGLMTEAGRDKVAAAKADGSWNRLESAETGEPPADLATALAAADALDGWRRFTLATRKRMVEHVEAAKRSETRAARVASVVEGARDGVDPLDWRSKREAAANDR